MLHVRRPWPAVARPPSSLPPTRLAWSIDAGRPVERPDVVACRYALRCH